MRIIIYCSGAFASLTVLALNGCGLRSWSQVALLEPALPCLQELYMAANDLSERDGESMSVFTGAEGTGIATIFIAVIAICLR